MVVGVVLAVLGVTLGAFIAVQMISNAAANDRLKVLEDSITLPDGWTKQEGSRHPASLLCFGMDDPCPSSVQVFEATDPTPDDLIKLVPDANLRVTGDCLHRGNQAGELTACTGTGHQNGFSVVASAVSLSGGRVVVSVSVRPE